jgi:hypothetical protein
MANFTQDLNPEVLLKVNGEADLAIADGRYIEAALLRHVCVEAVLRSAILHIIVGRYGIDLRYEKYFNDTRSRFSQLTRNAELLGLGSKSNLISRIDEYNKARNEIVHNVLFTESYEVLLEKARINAVLGSEISQEIIAFAQNLPCYCGSTFLTQDCHPSALVSYGM